MVNLASALPMELSLNFESLLNVRVDPVDRM